MVGDRLEEFLGHVGMGDAVVSLRGSGGLQRHGANGMPTGFVRPSYYHAWNNRCHMVARPDLDPYYRSFQNVSTHILAPELTEPAIREALRHGHAYVCHDWMCDPTGFQFEWVPADADPSVSRQGRGDEVKLVRAGSSSPDFPSPATSGCSRAGRWLPTREETNSSMRSASRVSTASRAGWMSEERSGAGFTPTPSTCDSGRSLGRNPRSGPSRHPLLGDFLRNLHTASIQPRDNESNH